MSEALIQSIRFADQDRRVIRQQVINVTNDITNVNNEVTNIIVGNTSGNFPSLDTATANVDLLDSGSANIGTATIDDAFIARLTATEVDAVSLDAASLRVDDANIVSLDVGTLLINGESLSVNGLYAFRGSEVMTRDGPDVPALVLGKFKNPVPMVIDVWIRSNGITYHSAKFFVNPVHTQSGADTVSVQQFTSESAFGIRYEFDFEFNFTVYILLNDNHLVQNLQPYEVQYGISAAETLQLSSSVFGTTLSPSGIAPSMPLVVGRKVLSMDLDEAVVSTVNTFDKAGAETLIVSGSTIEALSLQVSTSQPLRLVLWMSQGKAILDIATDGVPSVTQTSSFEGFDVKYSFSGSSSTYLFFRPKVGSVPNGAQVLNWGTVADVDIAASKVSSSSFFFFADVPVVLFKQGVAEFSTLIASNVELRGQEVLTAPEVEALVASQAVSSNVVQLESLTAQLDRDLAQAQSDTANLASDLEAALLSLDSNAAAIDDLQASLQANALVVSALEETTLQLGSQILQAEANAFNAISSNFSLLEASVLEVSGRVDSNAASLGKALANIGLLQTDLGNVASQLTSDFQGQLDDILGEVVTGNVLDPNALVLAVGSLSTNIASLRSDVSTELTGFDSRIDSLEVDLASGISLLASNVSRIDGLASNVAEAELLVSTLGQEVANLANADVIVQLEEDLQSNYAAVQQLQIDQAALGLLLAANAALVDQLVGDTGELRGFVAANSASLAGALEEVVQLQADTSDLAAAVALNAAAISANADILDAVEADAQSLRADLDASTAAVFQQSLEISGTETRLQANALLIATNSQNVSSLQAAALSLRDDVDANAVLLSALSAEVTQLDADLAGAVVQLQSQFQGELDSVLGSVVQGGELDANQVVLAVAALSSNIAVFRANVGTNLEAFDIRLDLAEAAVASNVALLESNIARIDGLNSSVLGLDTNVQVLTGLLLANSARLDTVELELSALSSIEDLTSNTISAHIVEANSLSVGGVPVATSVDLAELGALLVANSARLDTVELELSALSSIEDLTSNSISAHIVEANSLSVGGVPVATSVDLGELGALVAANSARLDTVEIELSALSSIEDLTSNTISAHIVEANSLNVGGVPVATVEDLLANVALLQVVDLGLAVSLASNVTRLDSLLESNVARLDSVDAELESNIDVIKDAIIDIEATQSAYGTEFVTRKIVVDHPGVGEGKLYTFTGPITLAITTRVNSSAPLIGLQSFAVVGFFTSSNSQNKYWAQVGQIPLGNGLDDIRVGLWNSSTRMSLQRGVEIHVGMNFDLASGTVTFFKDGSEDSTQPVSYPQLTENTIVIGESGIQSGSHAAAGGIIRDFRIYGRNLSASEIAALASGPTLVADATQVTIDRPVAVQSLIVDGLDVGPVLQEIGANLVGLDVRTTLLENQLDDIQANGVSVSEGAFGNLQAGTFILGSVGDVASNISNLNLAISLIRDELDTNVILFLDEIRANVARNTEELTTNLIVESIDVNTVSANLVYVLEQAVISQANIASLDYVDDLKANIANSLVTKDLVVDQVQANAVIINGVDILDVIEETRANLANASLDLSVLESNIIPLYGNLIIGDAENRFSEVHANSIFGELITAQAFSGDSANLTSLSTSEVSSSLVPDTNGTLSLGSETRKFASVYAIDGILEELTVVNTLTVADIRPNQITTGPIDATDLSLSVVTPDPVVAQYRWGADGINDSSSQFNNFDTFTGTVSTNAATFSSGQGATVFNFSGLEGSDELTILFSRYSSPFNFVVRIEGGGGDLFTLNVLGFTAGSFSTIQIPYIANDSKPKGVVVKPGRIEVFELQGDENTYSKTILGSRTSGSFQFGSDPGMTLRITKGSGNNATLGPMVISGTAFDDEQIRAAYFANFDIAGSPVRGVAQPIMSIDPETVDVFLKSNIVPDGQIRLGSDTRPFDEVYFGRLTGDGANLTSLSTSEVASSLIPDTNGTLSLGSETRKFASVYAIDSVLDELTVVNNLTVRNIMPIEITAESIDTGSVSLTLVTPDPVVAQYQWGLDGFNDSSSRFNHFTEISGATISGNTLVLNQNQSVRAFNFTGLENSSEMTIFFTGAGQYMNTLIFSLDGSGGDSFTMSRASGGDRDVFFTAGSLQTSILWDHADLDFPRYWAIVVTSNSLTVYRQTGGIVDYESTVVASTTDGSFSFGPDPMVFEISRLTNNVVILGKLTIANTAFDAGQIRATHLADFNVAGSPVRGTQTQVLGVDPDAGIVLKANIVPDGQIRLGSETRPFDEAYFGRLSVDGNIVVKGIDGVDPNTGIVLKANIVPDGSVVLGDANAQIRKVYALNVEAQSILTTELQVNGSAPALVSESSLEVPVTDAGAHAIGLALPTNKPLQVSIKIDQLVTIIELSLGTDYRILSCSTSSPIVDIFSSPNKGVAFRPTGFPVGTYQVHVSVVPGGPVTPFLVTPGQLQFEYTLVQNTPFQSANIGEVLPDFTYTTRLLGLEDLTSENVAYVSTGSVTVGYEPYMHLQFDTANASVLANISATSNLSIAFFVNPTGEDTDLLSFANVSLAIQDSNLVVSTGASYEYVFDTSTTSVEAQEDYIVVTSAVPTDEVRLLPTPTVPANTFFELRFDIFITNLTVETALFESVGFSFGPTNVFRLFMTNDGLLRFSKHNGTEPVGPLQLDWNAMVMTFTPGNGVVININETPYPVPNSGSLEIDLTLGIALGSSVQPEVIGTRFRNFIEGNSQAFTYPPLPTDAWTHVALRDKPLLIAYDGIEQGTLETLESVFQPKANLILGGEQVAVGLKLADVAVWNDVVTTELESHRLQVKAGTFESQGVTSHVSELLVGNLTVDTVSAPIITLPGLAEYLSDAEAAAGGIPIFGLYRNGNTIQIRLN